jgi:hypothetical protein
MARLGHSTPRASLIYQHATEQRDRQIAAGIDSILKAAKEEIREPAAAIVDIDTSREDDELYLATVPRTALICRYFVVVHERLMVLDRFEEP